MRALCIKDFRDLASGRIVHAGEVLEVTRARLDEINGTRYGTLAHEVPEPTVEARPRRRRSKQVRVD